MLDLLQFFKKYENKKIALYGLGTESEKVIRELDDFLEIIGLLDGFKEEGELYGKKIISLSKAIESKVELILVVARPGSCKAITKRIGNACKKNKIDLIDIRGKDLLVSNQIKYDFANIDGVSRDEVIEKINQADVISFDLFDTLVMRQTLDAIDIIEYVDCCLKENNKFINDFFRRRLESEKDLSKYEAPTLRQIYMNVLEKCNVSDILPETLAEMEWQIDYEIIVPRKDVCDIFKYAYSLGKKVYITSDTYYCKSQIEKIIMKCGITKYTEILASSEYGTGKTQRLFDILEEMEKGKKILHIGDDIVADIENALKRGFDVCKICGGQELLENVGYFGLYDYTDRIADRLKIGMFVSKIFNSPFQFEMDNRKIQIETAYDIGYLFCAPLISDFVIWFDEQIRNRKIENIWFGARDGYLIKKLYKELIKDDKGIYFFTSRIAAIRAAMEKEEDICYVDKMRFSGSLEENLKGRFGINVDDIKKEDISRGEEGLLIYKKPILEKAKLERRNYQKYISGLNLDDGDIAFFDFVAKGTSQMYIDKLITNHLVGLYFLQLEPEYMADKELEIYSFYTTQETNESAIFDSYYILETLLTAPHPSVCGFDEKGKPIYNIETRSEKDISCFKSAQEGILEYFRTYLKLCPKAELYGNKKIDEIFLILLHRITIADKDFLGLVVEDPFFNRMTDIMDLI